MNPKSVQISAVVSQGTKTRLDQVTRASGLKKAWIIENALNHYLQAMAELPADVIVPPRIVVDRETGERILKYLEQPGKPTQAMRELFAE